MLHGQKLFHYEMSWVAFGIAKLAAAWTVAMLLSIHAHIEVLNKQGNLAKTLDISNIKSYLGR